MAKSTNATAMILNLVLMLSLLLIFSVAQSQFLDGGFLQPNPSLVCDSVYGVQGGDICFSIVQKFNLTNEFFNSINPNLNCSALFIGEWLCIDGALH